MTLAAMAHERQFLDHLAPVWHALPASLRGEFLVGPHLMAHARSLGISATAIPRPPSVPAYPPPRHDGPRMLVASYGDIKVARRIGYGPFVFIEHGAGQSYAGAPGPQVRNGSYAGGADRDDVQLFLVPNEHAAGMWRKAYPDASVRIVGSPRLDALPQRDPGPGPVVCISFHWDARSISPEAGTAVGEYLPVLPDLAAEFTVIGHAHPKADWPERMSRLYRRAGVPFVDDFADVCRQADVYVCDNSTTLFEFAATGRPVVVLNSKFYRREVHHGLRFWDAATVGLQVDRPQDLVGTVRAALVDPPEQQQAREAALGIVYAHRSGGAARAAAAITDWLTSRVEVAA